MSTYQLHVGPCEKVMKSIPDNSIDAIVTDPPYGISFMGHKWDYQVPTIEQWAECLRILKPGGHLLAFGGSRTYHRLVINVEDAGFEIRDQILWVYGTGFPKSHNLDGDWEGWGTALKPAHEPIVMARKPFKQTVAKNVIQYGTGALNIRACRIATQEELAGGRGMLLSHQRDVTVPCGEYQQSPDGRWPANLIHDGSDEVIALFPSDAGAAVPVKGTEASAASNGNSTGKRKRIEGVYHGDKGSAARFFYSAKATPKERDEGMERFVAFSASDMTGGRKEGSAGINDPRAGAGRKGGAKNNHPTVKPISLMKYLCRMVTPTGGTVLDPFMGSGSTGRAAIEEGFNFIGIELDPDHVVTASARIGYSYKQNKTVPPSQVNAEAESNPEPKKINPQLDTFSEKKFTTDQIQATAHLMIEHAMGRMTDAMYQEECIKAMESAGCPMILSSDTVTENDVWPAEVKLLAEQVEDLPDLPAPHHRKVMQHINRMLLEKTPPAAIIQAAKTLKKLLQVTS